MISKPLKRSLCQEFAKVKKSIFHITNERKTYWSEARMSYNFVRNKKKEKAIKSCGQSLKKYESYQVYCLHDFMD